MITVRMKNQAGGWQEHDLAITPEELKAWRKEFRANQKSMMKNSNLPAAAYCWNSVAINTFRDRRPPVNGLDRMFLCFAIRAKQNPLKNNS